jgi:hypothetical protein
MKARLAEAALERLTNSAADEAPLSEGEVLSGLARVARTGKPGDRLRAAELIGKHLGIFGEKPFGEGRSFAELVLAAQRRRELKEAVTIEVVDPYACPKESLDADPDQEPH